MNGFPTRRLRRLRRCRPLRDMLASVRVSRDQLIGPLFVREGKAVHKAISSMPGQFQFSVDTGLETVRRWADIGLRAVLLLVYPTRKMPSARKHGTTQPPFSA